MSRSLIAERRIGLAPGQVLALRVESRRSGDVCRASVELTRADGYAGQSAAFDLPVTRLRAAARALEELAAEVEAREP